MICTIRLPVHVIKIIVKPTANKDRPLVYWTPRERQVVAEGDIVQNYELIKEYLYCVGHETPLPHQVHHEAINEVFLATPWLIDLYISASNSPYKNH